MTCVHVVLCACFSLHSDFFVYVRVVHDGTCMSGCLECVCWYEDVGANTGIGRLVLVCMFLVGTCFLVNACVLVCLC